MLITKKLAVLMLFSSLSWLVGCQILPTHSSQEPTEALAQNPDESLMTSLSIPPDQNRFNLSYSPWGNNITVEVIERYTAASGRECARLALIQTDPSNVLVCQYSKSSAWQPARHF